MGNKLKTLSTKLRDFQTASSILSSNFAGVVPEVDDFFKQVLAIEGILPIKKSGSKPLVTLSDHEITLIGKAQLFDMPKVEITLVFTEPGNKLDVNGTVKVLEEDAVKLPTLGSLLGKVLDDDLLASLPDQIKELPGVAVKSLGMEVGPKSSPSSKKKTLKNLQFNVVAEGDWPLVPGFLSTQSNGLDFNFENLLEQPKRKITGTASSSLTVADAPFEFSMEKTEDSESWVVLGNLAAGQKFKAGGLLNQFFSGFALPSDLPDFDIDDAGFTLEMQSKKVTFHSGSSQGLEIVTGYGIEKIGIAFERTPGTTQTAKADLTAGLVGTLKIDDIDVNLSAQLDQSGTGSKLRFEGTAATEKAIPIGKLIGSLASSFGGIEVPPSIAGAAISDIRATYEKDQELTFSFVTLMEAGGKEVKANILLRMTRQDDGSYEKAFEGLLVVGQEDPLEFELVLTNDGESSNLYATLRPGDLGSLSLSDLFQKVVDAPDGVIPDLEVSLVSAFVSISKIKVEGEASGNAKAKANLLFGVEVGVDMVFGDGLPLVGPMLNGQTIGVKTVLFSYTTASMTLKRLQKINLSLPQGKPKLPEVDLKGGIGLSFSMTFGKVKQYISLPTAEQPEPATPEAPPPPLTKPEREGKWFSVNKRLGPLSIVKVGVNFKDSVLTLGLDASLALGPLTLALEEFTMGSSIKEFSPEFNLHGFGIGWSGGPVEISGMFLRKPENDEYFGAALIKTPTLTLKAVGAFAMVRGEPSFYLYAYLGYPIGGPAFFFVEGLAAGFGFNRSVSMPTIDKVNTFPLVAMATSGKGSADEGDFLDLARDMANGGYVPIDLGKLFFAVGVRFTTFKQLDSFLLIIATFGKGFRLDLLGLSKLTVPSAGPQVKNKTPLAEVELAIMGTFAPDEGFIGVQAQLTKNSYILSKDCYLTGGFAFFTWFEPSEHAGDFVISLGGYHPQFVRPAHYPVVPRLGFNWQVSSEINVKGGMYFALTPTVLMAGGRLEATFRSGGLKAWFIIGADFIIGWKPFFYDARMYLSLGVSYTFWFFGKHTISFDIGADLHIWGPEFSGTAYIDLGIVDFTVEFGAGASQTPKPIRYSEFEKSFLPAANVASVSVTSGLLKEVRFGNEEVWVVNPKEFLLSTDSAVPSNTTAGLKEVRFGGKSVWMDSEDKLFAWLDDPEKQITDEVKPSIPFTGVTAKSQLKVVEVNRSQNIGIGTVGVKTDELVTQHTVKIFKGNDDFTAEFLYEPATKSFPAALWGENLLPDKNDKERVIAGLLSGLRVRPKPPADPDQMGFLDQDEFKFQTLTIPNSFAMGTAEIFVKNNEAVKVAAVNPVRANVLAALDLEDAFELDEDTDFAFAENPVVGRYGMVGGDTF